MNQRNQINFIKEIEKNSKIFREKISRLNSDYNFGNYQENEEYQTYKFSHKGDLYQRAKYETENNDEENQFKNRKKNNQNMKNKRINKKYDLDLNNIDNIQRNKNTIENSVYNTISNVNHSRKKNFKMDKKDKLILNIDKENRDDDDDNNEDIYDDSNKRLIEELKSTIKQKTNFIKVLKEELKEKEELPTQEEYDKLNYNYENNLNELNSAQKIIKNKNEEIDNLKMKLESIMAQNKNMKNVIVKKENEIEKLKLSINNIKEELKT